MAKLRPSLIKLKGTIMGVTFVDSKTYEPHARAARSTSAINDELVQSKERLLNSNKPAKLIFDAVRDEHKDGRFWPDLLSVFRKQLKEDGCFSFKGLHKLECSRKHKLDRLLHGQFRVDAVVNENMLDVTVTLLQHPKWDRMGYLDRYELSVTAVFPDFGEDTVSKATVRTPPILFKDALIPIHFQLPMPSADAPWVLFMGLAGGRKEYIYDLPQHKGLAVVKVSEGIS
jgi:hypothetical protein